MKKNNVEKLNYQVSRLTVKLQPLSQVLTKQINPWNRRENLETDVYIYITDLHKGTTATQWRK